MNWSKIFLAVILVFVAVVITELIIHAVILKGLYDSLGGNYGFRDRSQMTSYTWVMIIIGLVYSFFFVFIFAKGYEGKGIIEGIRYGIIIGFFWVFVSSFNTFSLFRMPYSLTWYWIIFGFIQTIIYGIITALVYKPKSA